jgi:two-component system phosphate regulon sensor histidine kinase PhoR
MTSWRQKYLSSPKVALISLLALEGITLMLFYLAVQSIRATLVSGSHAWADIQEILFLMGSTLFFLSALGLGVFLFVRTFQNLHLSQVREDFMNAISHDLKTPLTLVQLYGETLLYQDDLSAEDRKTYSHIIVRQSKRLTHLIEQVLDLSRIERAHKRYCFQEGDLAPVVTETVEDYVEHLHQQGFSVETKLTHQVPLDNARKYSGDRKSIAVRLWSEEDQVIFEVEDHGIGIPKELQKEVFQPFFRVYPSNGRPMRKGHGLGLFLVWHIMHAHGGKIEVISDGERGSRFRLVFPVAGRSEVSLFSFMSLQNALRGGS